MAMRKAVVPMRRGVTRRVWLFKSWKGGGIMGQRYCPIPSPHHHPLHAKAFAAGAIKEFDQIETAGGGEFGSE
jgi:hypothetical protein